MSAGRGHEWVTPSTRIGGALRASEEGPSAEHHTPDSPVVKASRMWDRAVSFSDHDRDREGEGSADLLDSRQTCVLLPGE